MNLLLFLKDKVGGLAHTGANLGKIGVDTLEKATGAALDSWQFYNGIGMQQLRALAAVHNPDTLRTFLGQSLTTGADVLKRAAEDMQRSMLLATEMRIAIEDLFSSITPPEPVPAPRTKAVTKSIPV